MSDQRLPRFSIATLLLATALIACAVSHFIVSRKLADTKNALTALRKDALVLDADDNSQLHVIALPTYGPLQWRWKVQLPLEGEYQIRYGIDQIPEAGFPSKSKALGGMFHDDDLDPLPGGIPLIVQVALSEDRNGAWTIEAFNGVRGAIGKIRNPPPWLASKTREGWGTFTSGLKRTDSSSADNPLLLMSMRKLKIVSATGFLGIDKSPTDGLAVWIKRIN